LELGGKREEQSIAYITYHHESRKIVAYVWGRRDIKTTQKLRRRIRRIRIRYERIGMDVGIVF
jgi:IS1 family transposase